MAAIPRPLDRVLNRLAAVTGLFGSRGWASVDVVRDDGEVENLPVTKEANSVIKYARETLRVFDREPEIPVSVVKGGKTQQNHSDLGSG